MPRRSIAFLAKEWSRLKCCLAPKRQLGAPSAREAPLSPLVRADSAPAATALTACASIAAVALYPL
jgi:hypothetical protein